MCTRYISPEQAEIERFWHIGRHNPARWHTELFPRGLGPFLRALPGAPADGYQLAVGQWGLVPQFADSPRLGYATHNARFEDITRKASFKHAWAHGRRCIIPAWSFDEPCWETGKNVWWRFRRADGAPWGLAGLWATWTNRATGEVVESYTMLTTNADDHALMARMHKPDPRLPPDRQDKRSPVAIDLADAAQWLSGSLEQAARLVRVAPVEVFAAAPA